VSCTVELYDVNKQVEPLKLKLSQMTKLQQETNQELEITSKLLEKLASELNDLNANRQVKQARLDDLTF